MVLASVAGLLRCPPRAAAQATRCPYYLLHRWPRVLSCWLAATAFGGVNAVAAVAMAIDKHRARRGGRRVPESWFYRLALVGGIGGVAAAVLLVRHKRRKRGFQAVVGAFGAIGLLLWGYLLWGLGCLP